MTLKATLTGIALIFALGACSNGDRFDDSSEGFSGTGGPNTFDPGSPSDPTSIAYFNQTVGDRVLFAVDQSSVSAEGQIVLNGQAQWLITNTEYTAIIEGHADEQGTREYNLALGARRANAVQEYLVSRGVASNRLKTVTFGKERPIEICSEEACYAQNRRAVTILSTPNLGS
jgi:peptidoglycan-associated lipoprotein